jgi:hypothetical protein
MFYREVGRPTRLVAKNKRSKWKLQPGEQGDEKKGNLPDVLPGLIAPRIAVEHMNNANLLELCQRELAERHVYNFAIRPSCDVPKYASRRFGSDVDNMPLHGVIESRH